MLEADLDLMCAVAVWMTMQTRSFGAGHISMGGPGQSRVVASLVRCR